MPENPTPTPVPEEAPPASSVHTSLWSALSWVRDLAFSVLIAVILINAGRFGRVREER